MEDVCMTCANMCGVQLVIVDISKSKPLLYWLTWKFIKFIKNKKQNLDAQQQRCNCAPADDFHGKTPSVFPAPHFLFAKFHQHKHG
jgi:hypothetical protein